jgi:ketosteroid isomerase-like protein
MHIRSIVPTLLAGVLAVALAGKHGRAEKPREAAMITEKTRATEEAEVRQVIDGLVRAVRAKDLDGAMAFYSPDIVSFDIEPPLQYVNTKHWNLTFAAYQGPIDYEMRDLSVTAVDDLAFAHSLNHVRGTLKNGRRTDMWVRWTACFRRTKGKWMIAHDHVSVPAQLETGEALLGLKP